MPNLHPVIRHVYFVGGILCLVLGFIGIFLPLLPTTPFILLAAFLFSKSSERLHTWMMEHRQFGPLIRDWHEHRVIRPRAKLLASVSIVVVTGVSLWITHIPIVLKLIVGAIGLGVIVLICSFRSRPLTDS
jgi:uncharacterized membrane protein YbaN (DUF454 family)